MTNIPSPRVARDSKGRFFVAPTAEEYEVLVTDSTGRVTQRLGQKGRGPGEFISIDAVVIGPGDSLHVFHSTLQSVFSPDLKFARQAPTEQFINEVIVQPSGDLIHNTYVFSENSLGYPLHRFNKSGALVRSFGTTAPAYDRSDVFGRYRALAPARGGGFWTVRSTAYVIEKWSDDGRLLERITRSADWFPPWSGVSRERASNSLSLSVREDPQGLIWVISNVARQHRERLGGATRLEAIDPKSGQLLASTALKGVARFVSWSDRIAAFVELPDGTPVVELLQVTLIRR